MFSALMRRARPAPAWPQRAAPCRVPVLSAAFARQHCLRRQNDTGKRRRRGVLFFRLALLLSLWQSFRERLFFWLGPSQRWRDPMGAFKESCARFSRMTARRAFIRDWWSARRRRGAPPWRPPPPGAGAIQPGPGRDPRAGRETTAITSGTQVPRGLARVVGAAAAGSSGQGGADSGLSSPPSPPPMSRAEARQVAGDLDWAMRRRQQMQGQRNPAAGKAGMGRKPVEFLNPRRQDGTFGAAVIEGDR